MLQRPSAADPVEPVNVDAVRHCSTDWKSVVRFAVEAA
jgi:hypothetical protein